MPNLNCEISVPKGFFFSCDQNIIYKQILFTLPTFDTTHLIIHYGQGTGEVFFKISNKEGETLSLLRLKKVNIANRDFYQISKIGTKSNYRSRGYAYQLYVTAIKELELAIISDTTLTIPGSYNIWTKLIQDSSKGNFEIQIINISTNKVEQYSIKKSKTSIWGYDPDLLNIIKEDRQNLEDAFYDNDITKELYHFISDNLKNLDDKRKIRIIAQKTKHIYR